MSNETELEEVQVEKGDVALPADEQAAGYARDLSWSPGMLLKRAREQQKMSREELSVQTKLSVGTVRALESDDFDTLSEAVYTRGYYRRCAGVLGLSADEVLKAYERASGEPPPQPLPLKPSVGQEEVRTPARWMPYLFFLLLAACLVAAVMWWTQRSAQPPAAAGGAGAAVQAPASAGAASSSTRSSTVVPAQGAAAAGSSGAAPAAPPLPPLPTPAKGASANVQQGSSAQAPPPVAAKPAKKAAKPAKVAQAASAGGVAAAAAGSHALKLVFKHKSWVDVTDARGKTLLSGLMPGGTNKTLTGKPPYDVLLGYAPGVTIAYGGHTIPLDSYVRSNNTAHLSVGQSH